ncbi:MAG: ATP-binding protein [Caldilineaceae bacterium SB0666_bin_21]|nr:ATP-binding protein [Caldilineaceae bacterium SB0666_bin_21]
MITLVEALNYRCLRYVQRPMKPFHVLVGPNASGKTTFLDVIAFLSDLVSDGLDAALSERSPVPEALLFAGKGDRFELAVEARIPNELRDLTSSPNLDTVRYEIAIGFDEFRRGFEIKDEGLLLKKAKVIEKHQHSIFPMHPVPLDTLQTQIDVSDVNIVVDKIKDGKDKFLSENYGKSDDIRGYLFELGPQRSTLGNLPADPSRFPVAIWFRDYLSAGVQRFVLNSSEIKRPSPPTRVAGFLPDGSNLPWVVARMREEDPKRYSMWIAHLKTALDDLKDITTVERPEDRHCYMVYEYVSGLKVPSWLVSDGSLRLTALTLPAYLSGLQGIYLIEEPENGVHPKAVVAVYDSLSSVYESQVLLATHSPVVLNAVDIDDVLCFAKDDDGATDIVLGSEHPKLQNWQGMTDLGTLLASGVLG